MGKYGLNNLLTILRDSPYLIACAFDPGDATGFCGIAREAPMGEHTMIITLSQEDLFDSILRAGGTPTVVFYEDFISRGGSLSRTQLAPQNVGAIKCWARSRGFQSYAIQPHQTHKIKREDVRAAGWTWSTEHEFDAIRIMIFGLTMLANR